MFHYTKHISVESLSKKTEKKERMKEILVWINICSAGSQFFFFRLIAPSHKIIEKL